MGRAGFVVLLIMMVGCEDEQPQQSLSVSLDILSQSPAACQDYGDDADVFGYCMVEQVSNYSDLSEASDHCVLAGEWESRCRHRWVNIQLRTQSDLYSTKTLLEVCAENAECAFELLEFRSDPDLEVQLNLCMDYTGPFVQDCMGHAVQHWWIEDRSREELIAAAHWELAAPYPETMGYWFAASVACDERVICEEASAAVASECERHEGSMTRKPHTCPTKGKSSMHGDNPDNYADRGAPERGETGPLDETQVDGGAGDPLAPEMTRDLDPGPSPSPGPSNPYPDSKPPLPVGEPVLTPQPSPPPAVPDPGPTDGGTKRPNPNTHGHVPDGTPGGGMNPPPPGLGSE